MEDETTGQAVAEPEAPPGDTGAAVAVADTAPSPAAEAEQAVELKDDYSNFDEWAAADAARINAEAAAEDSGEAPPATDEAPQPVEAAAPPPTSEPTPPPAQTDYERVVAEMVAKGYKVEPPAPPPDPYQQLLAELVAERGTDEEYASVKQAALAYVPAEPPTYDSESVAAHEAAVKARNEAAAKLQAYDQGRRITDRSLRFARDRALGDLGAAFSALPQTYDLPPERAARVTTPQTVTDAVSAIVETVTERLNAAKDAEIAALTKKFEGEVARAKSDRSAAAVERMGRAPQATSEPGGRQAGPGPLYETIPGTDLPTEAAIQRMIRGDFASVDLSNR
jgi:hypothetical protein